MPKVTYRLVNKATYHEEAVCCNSWPIGFYFKNAHWNVNRLPPTALGNTFMTSYHPWLLWVRVEGSKGASHSTLWCNLIWWMCKWGGQQGSHRGHTVGSCLEKLECKLANSNVVSEILECWHECGGVVSSKPSSVCRNTLDTGTHTQSSALCIGCLSSTSMPWIMQ